MALDWRDYQEQNERREKTVRDLQDAFQASNRRSEEAAQRRFSTHHAKTIPTYPAMAWGSFGLGGCFAFLLGIVVLCVASLALCCGMIGFTSHAKPGHSVPHQTAPKHHGPRHHEKGLHPFSSR